MTTDPRLLSDETLDKWEADANRNLPYSGWGGRIAALRAHIAAQAEQVAHWQAVYQQSEADTLYWKSHAEQIAAERDDYRELLRAEGLDY